MSRRFTWRWKHFQNGTRVMQLSLDGEWFGSIGLNPISAMPRFWTIYWHLNGRREISYLWPIHEGMREFREVYSAILAAEYAGVGWR